MSWKLSVFPKTLHFLKPATTSRGQYTDRNIWLVTVEDSNSPHVFGVGECAPLPDLSCDVTPDYAQKLLAICQDIEKRGEFSPKILRDVPSMLFGLETAFRHAAQDTLALWDSPFSRGEKGIPINGLIWMGNKSDMFTQIQAKLTLGFRCVKLKIGAINFDDELALIRYIRSHFCSAELELRLDANGAFAIQDAYEKLCRLAEWDIHSIEQPIKAGQWQNMAELVSISPLPIALDEELIGVNAPKEKRRLLETIRPHYIILKPSLHGGLSGSDEWINLAQELDIGWWATSALESNIGLNAIAQWVANKRPSLPQGLGTGQLFQTNFPMPLFLEKDAMRYCPEKEPDCLRQMQEMLYTPNILL